MLGNRLQLALKNAGISAADAASYIGISEANLYKLFKKDTFEVAYLRKAAELLDTTVAALLDDEHKSGGFHTGDFNIVGSANTQKVKVNKAPAQELAKQLEDCQRDVEGLKRELALANALIAAKDETITLLRGSYRNPN